MTVWHLLLDAVPRPGAENMALDVALLEEADHARAAFLRLYRWDPPSLSFGRHEPAAVRYDRTAIERLGLATVRRPTGGRAVWHEHEVTYAVAAPVATFGSLRNAYLCIHERMARALRSLSVEATLARDRRRPSGSPFGPCFAAPTGGEVLVDGKKLVGSAQVRRGTAFLQHGSMLLDGSQDVIRAVSRQPSAVSRATTLAAILGRTVSFDEVAQAIVTAWGEPLTSTNLHQPPASSTVCFSDPAWTWRR